MTGAVPFFKPEYVEGLNYTEFYNAVIDAQYKKPYQPYRYGAYQVFQANKANHQIQANFFMNFTS